MKELSFKGFHARSMCFHWALVSRLYLLQLIVARQASLAPYFSSEYHHSRTQWSVKGSEGQLSYTVLGYS
jgi:hypothetical protein